MYELDEWHEAFEVFRPAVQIERRLWSGRLYKYCTNEVADLMLRNGSVCVGNAEYYRRMQKAHLESRGQVAKLNLSLTGTLSGCVAKLQSLQTTVAEYAMLESPAEQGSTASMSQSADRIEAVRAEPVAPKPEAGA